MFSRLVLVLLLWRCAPFLAAEVDVIDDDLLTQKLKKAVIKLKEEGRLLSAKVLLNSVGAKKPIIPANSPTGENVSRPENPHEWQRRVLIHCQMGWCAKEKRWWVGFSTAFAIASDVVVFNYHALADPQEEFHAVANREGSVFPITRLLALDKTNDFVIAQVSGGEMLPLPLEADEPVGNPVTVISHPDNLFFVVTRGIVARYGRTRRACVRKRGLRERGFEMLITADFSKGSSGAPVINQRGNVVGMVSATDSIYFEENQDCQRNLQMVVKKCVPARNILDAMRQEMPVKAGESPPGPDSPEPASGKLQN